MPRYRVSRVTTRSGDEGRTALADGTKYVKHDDRIELVGVLDEANASLGLVVQHLDSTVQDELIELQSRLFDVGAAVATGNTPHHWDAQTKKLSMRIHEINSGLEPLREFVLPGSNETSARLHMARTIIRRAERAFWKADMSDLIAAGIGQYLNRLSDYLFVLARATADEEILWQPLSKQSESSD